MKTLASDLMSAATPDAPEIVGTLALALGMGAAAAKCLAMMRRGTVSKLCVLSLACFFATCSILCLGGLAGRSLSGPLGNGLAALAGAVACLGYLGAGVLAIVGLATYSSPPHTQGRAQAIWALVLVVVPLLSVVVSAVVAVAASVGSETSRDKGAAEAERIVNQELNFRFDPPRKPWVAINAKLHNPDAAVMYRKTRPESIFMVIAEAVGTEAGFTNESLVDVAQANLKANDGVFEFESLADRSVNGIDFSVFRTRTSHFEGRRGPMRWEHWVAIHHGYAYQLVLFAGNDDKGALSAEAEELAARFAPADPGHILTTTGIRVEPYSNPAEGVAVDLSSEGWVEYADREEDYPESSFAASSGMKSTGVVSVHLGELDPGIDELASGFLAASFDFLHPEKTEGRREVGQGAASGIETTARRDVNGEPYSYCFRVLRHGAHAWFLAAWGKGEILDELGTVLDRYRIEAPVDDGSDKEESKASLAKKSQMLNQAGLAYYRRENHLAALPFYEEAFRRNPESPIYFDNVVDALFRSGRYDKAVDAVRSQGELAAARPVLRTYEGASLRALERHAEAADAYALAFAAGYEDEDDLFNFINTLVEIERQEQGIEVLVRYRRDHPGASMSVERWRASLLSQLERHEEAIALLEEVLETNPASLRIASDLVGKRIDAGHYSEALADVEALLAGGSRNAELLLLKGRAKLGLESYREARAAFEEARSLSPENREIGSYIEHTSTLLGKGDVSSIRRWIEPVGLPAEVSDLADRLVGEHAASLPTEYGAAYVQRLVGVFHEPGKPRKTTSRTVVRITGPAGLDDFSTLQFRFDPAVESVHVNELVVTDRDGESVGVGDVDDYFLVDENSDELATTEKVVHVPVPGIAVGTTISYTVTTESHHPDKKFEYGSTAFGSYCPSVGKIHYFLSGADRIATHKTAGVERIDFDGGIAFYAEAPPVLHNEPMQTWLPDFQPWLAYADSSSTWMEEARAYLERLAPVMGEDGDLVKSKAEEIAAGLRSEQDRIRAISDYVADTLTYQGIEFGPRGRIPERCSTILRNRYGDCKDHSLLLVKLLQSVGIEAHLALVSTEAPIREELASLDQFNHMIAYVPGAGGSPFFDTTGDRFPFGELAPQYLLHERALILDPANVRFETVLPTEGTVSRIDSQREIQLDPKNADAVLVKESLRLTGYPAAWFRSSFDRWRVAEHVREIAGLLRDYGSPDVRSLTVEGLESSRGSLGVELLYAVPNSIVLRDGTASLSPPAVWERYFIEHRDTTERRNPFEILVPTEFTSRATIVMPDRKADARTVGEFALDASDDFFDWSISARQTSPDQVEVVSRSIRKPGTHPKERFREFVRSANRGIETWRRSLLFAAADGQSR